MNLNLRLKASYVFILIFISLIISSTIFSIHKRKPNVIFIVLDAARADHFSCYGYKESTTPCIDALSQKGAVFLNNVSQGTETTGSLPKIFSSRYFSTAFFQINAWARGIQHENPLTILSGFDKEQISLTKVLSLNGYRSVIFSELTLNKKNYLVQDFQESYLVELKSRPKMISSLISWVEKNKYRRFFIYCHIMSPHIPYWPKDEDKGFFADEQLGDVERVRRRLAAQGGYPNGWNQDELNILRGLYDTNLKQADKWIGLIYDKLKELRLENKTLIVITSDHGENLGEHNSFGHGGIAWNSLIKVPLVIVYPPLIPSETKMNGFTESIDIMPTILDACGIKLPRGKSMDGVSLFKFIDKPDSGKGFALSQNSIQIMKYKYIAEGGRLFDIKKDPGEEINIAEEKPMIAKWLEARLAWTTSPYHNRFLTAKLTTPPDFPFYFTMSTLKIAPNDIIKHDEYFKEDIAAFLKESSLQKPYPLDSIQSYANFLFIPKAGLPYPVAFTTDLPNGIYRIFILLESLSEISSPVQQFGFQFRFNQQSSFNYPYGIDSKKNSSDTYYYLNLGETRVDKRLFYLEAKFQPPDNTPYIMHHIKFVPKGLQENELTEETEKEELRRKTEDLKSLGYL